MVNVVKEFFRRGAIRISREKERAFYFYAAVVLFVLYLVNHVQGGG